MKYLFILFFFIIFILTSCSFAPPYHPPIVSVAAHYKEANRIWIKTKITTSYKNPQPWWTIYQDEVLNQLEEKICHNQDLKVAVARYDEARAMALIARAQYFPIGYVVGNASRQGLSKTIANTISPATFNDLLAGLDISYELDAWGRVRNAVKSANKQAEASAADIASVQLSLQSELAVNYFSLRAADRAQMIYEKTIKMYKRALILTRHRFEGGASPVADLDQAEVQYETAKTQAADNHLKRVQFEHAIAVLIGQSPSCFVILPKINFFHFANVSPDLPSTLLQRRPDIAASELRVEAANADIGVARAAYFPAINLAGGMGLESSSFRNLFQLPSIIWALGPSGALGALTRARLPLLNYTLFDGGKINAMTQQSWAVYMENIALYRQTVLNAFQEVEDNLIALKQLDQENISQHLAANAANRALLQAMYRYRGGLTTYLDVVLVQNLALQAELADVDVQVRRQIASVKLVKALGGGWII